MKEPVRGPREDVPDDGQVGGWKALGSSSERPPLPQSQAPSIWSHIAVPPWMAHVAFCSEAELSSGGGSSFQVGL